MSDSVLDQILESFRNSSSKYFPQHGQLKAVRVVGHTPKPDHYTYEVVLDFEAASARISAKLYRGGKPGQRVPQELARNEVQNLQYVWQESEKRKLSGIPCPIGDFTELGAVASTKVNGLPLQSIIMKVALLPDNGNHALLQAAARQAGGWLRQFHRITAGVPTALNTGAILEEMERLCLKGQKDGLPAEATATILKNARVTLSRHKKPVRSSAVLNDYLPLNVMVSESGVGFSDFASLSRNGVSLHDAAVFLAAVEALEKYPFCDRRITALVQDTFLEAYGVSAPEHSLLSLMKMKVLLQMFAQGRSVKESAVRKKVMWANVMKRFIQQAAERSMAPAA